MSKVDIMTGVLNKLLKSQFVWRLAGITYPTAVIATHGVYLSKNDYFQHCFKQTKFIHPLLNDHARVLEFGCGIGGNLLSIADKIQLGVGIDVNSLFIHRAGRFAKRQSKKNLTFVSYDGNTLPIQSKFDVIFSLGVFERIAKPIVKGYLLQMRDALDEHGVMAIYFLTPRAIDSSFVRLLGSDAYVYWTRDELSSFFVSNSMNVESFMDKWGYETKDSNLQMGDVVIVRRTLGRTSGSP